MTVDTSDIFPDPLTTPGPGQAPREPLPGEVAFDMRLIERRVLQIAVAHNQLFAALSTVAYARWEVVDARASIGQAGALRGDQDLIGRFGPPYRVEWLVDVGQAVPTNYWERGRVEGDVTYPGDYIIEIAA
jgi:hypothetical protein